MLVTNVCLQLSLFWAQVQLFLLISRNLELKFLMLWAFCECLSFDHQWLNYKYCKAELWESFKVIGGSSISKGIFQVQNNEMFLYIQALEDKWWLDYVCFIGFKNAQ